MVKRKGDGRRFCWESTEEVEGGREKGGRGSLKIGLCRQILAPRGPVAPSLCVEYCHCLDTKCPREGQEPYLSAADGGI